MQDQLEFHTAFSGLWPKAQGATAGLNASNATTHHLPFAEASLSHKHRKRVGSEGDVEDGAAADDSAAAEEGDPFVQKPPASAEQVEEANGWMLLKPAMSSFKHAFAVEESHRGFMRGLKSISNTEPYPGSSSLYDTKVSRCN
ncbi:hypothetical protein CVIRNUC_003805 [Coccomyxa viridis]|uniref:Uncharacterized protein n=1 Tax=Coccomyxa viridis TaxID=1274662 RepID=A0AAV1I2M9_9CHLO|nr:hypothetical protein CVIRNUC_003805 [Coccomyxa viridis]